MHNELIGVKPKSWASGCQSFDRSILWRDGTADDEISNWVQDGAEGII